MRLVGGRGFFTTRFVRIGNEQVCEWNEIPTVDAVQLG